MIKKLSKVIHYKNTSIIYKQKHLIKIAHKLFSSTAYENVGIIQKRVHAPLTVASIRMSILHAFVLFIVYKFVWN